jgi:hypothetical protein
MVGVTGSIPVAPTTGQQIDLSDFFRGLAGETPDGGVQPFKFIDRTPDAMRR